MITTLSLDEGVNQTYYVKLGSKPRGKVTVKITEQSGTTLTLDNDGNPNTPFIGLTFDPITWNSPKALKVSADQDANTSDETVTLLLSASGGGYDDVDYEVSVMVNDDDDEKIVLSPISLAVNEEGSATYTIALGTQPSASVTMEITGQSGTTLALDNDGDPNTSFAGLTFYVH